MVSGWQKAVFAWSFGMVWGFAQAVVNFIHSNFYYDPFWFTKRECAEYYRTRYDQPEPELTKEQQESLDEQWPSGESEEPSDDEWVSAQKFFEELEKCDRLYRRAEAEYLEVVRNTAPDDPVREKYRPKPFPSKKEMKESYYRHCGMFNN